MHPRLVRRDPLAAELVRLAADLRVPEPPADAVARLEDDDVTALGDEPARSGEAGDARTDDGDVGLDQAGVHASLLERGGRGGAARAHRALHVPGDPLIRAADVERRLVRAVQRADAQHVARPPVRRVAARERIDRPHAAGTSARGRAASGPYIRSSSA